MAPEEETFTCTCDRRCLPFSTGRPCERHVGACFLQHEEVVPADRRPAREGGNLRSQPSGGEGLRGGEDSGGEDKPQEPWGREDGTFSRLCAGKVGRASRGNGEPSGVLRGTRGRGGGVDCYGEAARHRGGDDNR